MKRNAVSLIAVSVLVALPLMLIPSPLYARTTAIAAVCLFIWLTDSAPPFVPALLLWALIPIVLGPLEIKYELSNILEWAVDPVLALFFGGFVLGIATETIGFDKRLMGFAFRLSGVSFGMFLFVSMAVTAFLSMWLSNIAAAALVLACLRPALSQMADDHVLRRNILVGVALAADMGGIATPIGTGPNAIAIGAIAPQQAISFVNWMIFGSPLAAGMILLAFFMLRRRTKGVESEWMGSEILSRVRAAGSGKFSSREIGFLLILIVTAGMWLSEPLHKVPSAVVALAAAAVLFLSGILAKRDLLRIDWSTLLLIAGGITLGRLLEQTGIVHDLAASIPFSQFNVTVSLFILCLTSAALSALMSNTATAVMLIPLAMALIPYPSTAILIAVSASFGLPFMISTPQNSMVFGEGGLRFKDLFHPGIILMIVGCLIVSLTGRMVLNVAGIP